MKLAICIVNHDQNHMVADTVRALSSQTVRPDKIFVCSDGTPCYLDHHGITCINNTDEKGRCRNRNSVIPAFLKSDCDALVFIDGDTAPENKDFIAEYARLLERYDLVFGTRRHTDPKGLDLPASDLLTANMDNLWKGAKLDYRDLRVVSGAVDAWQSAKSFYERLDLMVTGMVGWSCNFGITREGLGIYLDYVEKVYGRRELFDTAAFSGGWGYEDVAMGIDALYAGLMIWISDSVRVVHSSHDRTDGLFDHVVGRHLIMERVRALEEYRKVRDKTYLTLMILFGTYIAGVITGMVTGFISIAE